jgi:hypothetical protein
VITNSISNVNNDLVLWAFERACLDEPAERITYYYALVEIGELEGRNEVKEKVNELNDEGKLTRKLNE